MKKRFLFTLIILLIVTVSTVKAQFSIGPGVIYGTKIKQLGLTANVAYDMTKKWGLMADYTYYFPKNSLNWWSLDFDARHNICSMNDKNSIYALAGLNLLYYKVPNSSDYLGSPNVNYTGLNIGAGWKIALKEKINLIPEARFTFGNLDYLRLGVKLMFTL